MCRQIKIGVLGCAKIAEKAILPAINILSEHYDLVGVASRAKKKADKFSDQFNTRAYYNYKDLLAIEELDAVYIPLPNSLHNEWIDYALDAGLNVLVEKSMACNLKEVEELNRKAENKQLLLMENFQFRFHPQLKFIRNLLQNGEIGELRSLKSSFSFPPLSDPNNIRYNAKLGGGALLDAGAYPLKILQYFLGNEAYVIAAKSHFNATKGIDIWGSGYIGSKDHDVGAYISFGFDNYYQCEIELVGSLGRIYTDRIFTAPPNYSPAIDIHRNNSDQRSVKLQPANHFINLLMNLKIRQKSSLNKLKFEGQFFISNRPKTIKLFFHC